MTPFKSIFTLVAICGAPRRVHFRRPAHAHRICGYHRSLQRCVQRAASARSGLRDDERRRQERVRPSADDLRRGHTHQCRRRGRRYSGGRECVASLLRESDSARARSRDWQAACEVRECQSRQSEVWRVIATSTPVARRPAVKAWSLAAHSLAVIENDQVALERLRIKGSRRSPSGRTQIAPANPPMLSSH